MGIYETFNKNDNAHHLTEIFTLLKWDHLHFRKVITVYLSLSVFLTEGVYLLLLVIIYTHCVSITDPLCICYWHLMYLLDTVYL